jgi:hypothetical protein
MFAARSAGKRWTPVEIAGKAIEARSWAWFNSFASGANEERSGLSFKQSTPSFVKSDRRRSAPRARHIDIAIWFQRDMRPPIILHTLAIPLSRRLKEVLVSFGEPVDGRSWYVFWRFKRPLPKWKILRKEIQQTLDGLDHVQRKRIRLS